MGLGDTTVRQPFPVAEEELFDTVRRVLPPAGFTIDRVDTMTRRIHAKSGMSALSYGEDLLLRTEKAETGSILEITSTLKIGVNLTGTSRNSKNVERVIGATSAMLRAKQKAGGNLSPKALRVAAERAADKAPSNATTSTQWMVMGVVGGLLLLSMLVRFL
jgi:hypothetical protein